MPSVVSAETQAGFTQPAGIGSLLSTIAAATPDKEAVVFGGERLTYRNLESLAFAVATQLSGLGVKRGDRVGLLFPNRCGYVSSFFGASGIGATIVPINPLLKSEEIAHILSDSQASVIIVHELSLDEVLKGLSSAPSVRFVLVSRTTPLPLALESAIPDVQVMELTSRATLAPGNWTSAVDPHADLALLVYTSGTTGRPKGAMLTHDNLFSAIRSAHSALALSWQDRFLAVLPLCHIYGLAVVMLGTICRGGTLVIVEKFDAQGVLATIEAEKVTLVPVVPAMYQFMLMELQKNQYNLDSVRVCLSGAAALPTELIERIETSFHAALIEGYGMTESSCIATVNPINGVRKPGSVGIAVESLQVEVFADDGRALPHGADNVGEVALRGANVMRGYYRRPEATAECFRDGWFFTGDLGYKDEDGYLFLVGRKKELIIRGGQNIYPREVEEMILRMPEVAEVAVIGVPDRYMGERVKAVVALNAGHTLSEQSVKDFCAARLAEYKVPRLVEFIDRLPRNSTGKVLKRVLS